jgi:hypothetical protein
MPLHLGARQTDTPSMEPEELSRIYLALEDVKDARSDALALSTSAVSTKTRRVATRMVWSLEAAWRQLGYVLDKERGLDAQKPPEAPIDTITRGTFISELTSRSG